MMSSTFSTPFPIMANGTNSTAIMNGTFNITNQTDFSLYINGHYNTMNAFYDEHTPINKIKRVVIPLWYVLGIPGNFMSFCVWIQRRMRHSSGVYLAALSMADFLFLILSIIYNLQDMWDIPSMQVPVWCSIFPMFFLSLQYMGPLMVLGFTLERYIAICHPFQREKFCTMRIAVRMTIGLTITSFLLSLIQGYFYVYDYESTICQPRASILIGGPASLWSIWTWVLELLIFAAVPLIVVVFNLLVIREAKRLSRHDAILMQAAGGKKSKQKAVGATTFMLLAVSFYLIMGTIPVTLVYALSTVFQQGEFDLLYTQVAEDPVWKKHFVYATVRTTVEVIGFSHYASKFYIYILTGDMFRRELKLLVRRVCKLDDPMKANSLWAATQMTDDSTPLKKNKPENGTCV